MREAKADGKLGMILKDRRRIETLELLEKLGLNVPIYARVTDHDYSRAFYYKKQCAIRFDVLNCELPKVDGLVIPGPPPLVAHSSPCVARELFDELTSKGCEFEAHVTDVTIADSVGAGVTMKWQGTIVAEISVGGSVRKITREGKVDARAYLEGQGMKVEGSLEGLLSYCAFESLRSASTMPDGVLEWSCHKGRYGLRGDHIVYWEYLKI